MKPFLHFAAFTLFYLLFLVFFGFKTFVAVLLIQILYNAIDINIKISKQKE